MGEIGFLSKKRAAEFFAGAAIFLAMLGLCIRPEDTIGAAKDGLMLCYNVILPTLFPFFVLSSMLVELGLVRYIGKLMEKIMRPLFNVSGSCAAAFALGFVGGYPTGARTAISIYDKKMCTRTEAERMLSFCNNSGPAFILGVIGAGIFSSGKAGVLLYIAHAAASVTVGIIFRFYKRNEKRTDEGGRIGFTSVGFAEAFTTSAKGALSSTLNICAFVVFFTVTIKMLVVFGIIPVLSKGIGFLLSPIGLGATEAEQLITGFIEMSSGVWTLRNATAGLRQQLAMAAFMLGWAGISVHCQVLSFIGESGLSTRTYIIGKMLQGIISAVYTYLISGLFGFTAPASSYFAEQIEGLSRLSFTGSLAISLTVSGVILGISAVIIFIGKSGRRRSYGGGGG